MHDARKPVAPLLIAAPDDETKLADVPRGPSAGAVVAALERLGAAARHDDRQQMLEAVRFDKD